VVAEISLAPSPEKIGIAWELPEKASPPSPTPSHPTLGRCYWQTEGFDLAKAAQLFLVVIPF
jgi:hypothetical protein